MDACVVPLMVEFKMKLLTLNHIPMKKNVFILLACIFMSLTATFAQSVKEPEFVGEVYLLTSDSTYIPLPKSPAEIKAKGGLSMGIPLLGSVKSYMSVKGTQAETRIKNEGHPIQMIVRCKANDIEPTNLITILSLEVKKKERRILMNKVSILGGSSTELNTGVPFKFEKYGEHSYKITLDALAPGEYGLMISEGEQVTGSFIGLRCLGVD